MSWISVVLGRVRLIPILLMWALGVSPAAADGQPAGGGQTPGAPGGPPAVVSCVRVEVAPVIDGVLDDACWQAAEVSPCFYLNEREGVVTEQTAAYLCSDDRNIYVAFDCRDSQPEKIVAAQRRRGAGMGDDDFVSLSIDRATGGLGWYTFEVSPLGTQNHNVPGGSAPKIEWQGDWHAAARVTERGWQAEMAIPFSILAPPQGTDTFALCFTRYLAREREHSVWPYVEPAADRSDRPATWTGVVVPRFRHPLVAMPYGLFSIGDHTADAAVGLDLKRTFPSGATAAATIHPDFRSIEQDVESIDFSYTERQLEDRRPFFVEGQSGYLPDAELLYTRRVEDLDAGLKAFGKLGSQRFGALFAGVVGRSDLAAGRYSYEPGRNSKAWVGAVNYSSVDQRHSLATEVGASLRRPKSCGDASLYASAMRSVTNGDGGEGSAYYVSAERDRGNSGTSYYLAMDAVASGFNPALGYVPEKGLHHYEGEVSYERQPQRGRYWRRAWRVSAESATTPQDSRFRINLWGKLSRRNQTQATASVDMGRREGYPDRTASLELMWNDQDTYRCGKASMSLGEKAGGAYRYGAITKAFRPSQRLSCQGSIEYLDHDAAENPRAEYQGVVQGTYDFTSEETVSGRLVLRENRLNVFIAYRRVVRAGLDTYVLIGDPNAATTQARAAIKLVSAFMF